jgi:hypothetical protein
LFAGSDKTAAPNPRGSTGLLFILRTTAYVCQKPGIGITRQASGTIAEVQVLNFGLLLDGHDLTICSLTPEA